MSLLSSLFSWLFSTTAPLYPPIPPKYSHRYYPPGVEIHNLALNKTDLPKLATLFAGGLASVLLTVWLIMSKTSSTLSLRDRFTVLWFVLSGTLHLFFEGYFIYNHTRMGDRQDILGQLWKEYALSDSRYLTSNTFVVCIETITVFFWGPLSYLTAYFISASHRFRHPFQVIVATAHIYGSTLYFATSFFDICYRDVSHSRPEVQYFWIYFVSMNILWIVIPSLLLSQSITVTVEAFSALNRMQRTLQGSSNNQKPSSNGNI